MKLSLFILVVLISNVSMAQQNQNQLKLEKTDRLNNFDFAKIKISRIGKVVFLDGSENSVSIECSEGELESVVTKVKGKTLNIYTKKEVAASNSTVYITIKSKNLNIDASTVGSIVTNGQEVLRVEEFRLLANGIGSVNLNINADVLDIQGKAFGSINLKGKGRKTEFDLRALGFLDAHDFVSEAATVKIEASSEISIHVTTSLYMDTKGCPSISLKGDPITTISNIDPDVTIEKL